MKIATAMIGGLLALTLLSAGALSGPGNATATGLVKVIRMHDPIIGNVNGVDGDLFTIQGVVNLVSCYKYNGNTAFRLRDGAPGRRMLATLLSALVSGKKVTVTVDDTQVSQDWCRALAVDISP